MTVLPYQTNMPDTDGSTINRTKSDCDQSRGVALTRSLEGKEKGKGKRGKGIIYIIYNYRQGIYY